MEVARHPDIKRTVLFAGEDVDRWLSKHGILDSRFRGNDTGEQGVVSCLSR